MYEVIVAAISRKLNISFTDEQKVAVTEDIADYLEELENKLHATLIRRERTDQRQITPFGALNLLGPIIQIHQVVRVGDSVDSTFRFGHGFDQRDMIYPDGAQMNQIYEVTYEAGYPIDPAVKNLLRDVFVRNKIVGVQVSSGAYSSINVEGASVGYGPAVTAANAQEQDGSFTRNELKKLRHLHRLVIA